MRGSAGWFREKAARNMLEERVRLLSRGGAAIECLLAACTSHRLASSTTLRRRAFAFQFGAAAFDQFDLDMT